ncbi:hypothetical protein WMY93_004304 [Mugilogobius chulae]|uniref:UPA domain-containing protein n=1 Tax=Mugilogobius chulae TaxID=88201 RepID=A0AAW0PRX6_9GOBI
MSWKRSSLHLTRRSVPLKHLQIFCLGVVWAERSRGGQLLEEPQTLEFRASSFSLQVSIQDVPQFLWSIKPFTTCQEFSFSQVWCSNQSPLHCAFSLERFSPATAQLSCKISVRQVKGHEQMLQVYTAVTESEKESLPFFSQSDCSVTTQSGPRAFRIPPSIHQRICATFDTANAKGNDWQLLARKLHLDRNLVTLRSSTVRLRSSSVFGKLVTRTTQTWTLSPALSKKSAKSTPGNQQQGTPGAGGIIGL